MFMQQIMFATALKWPTACHEKDHSPYLSPYLILLYYGLSPAACLSERVESTRSFEVTDMVIELRLGCGGI